ncbi:hypothetical protein GN958_ATG12745 [Phytophthora infestans]|uniref:Uncharacterized protein n=1 Tax=Phytophthora infestans TaxID=4787 RepID=A0A8S9UBU8_PHYIN|nr:hypothetical protein GN958_ATG12745 [Phytophthora infestans]
MANPGALVLRLIVEKSPRKKDLVCFREVADNLVDLNTPTLHTKETIAPLALKNGHRDLYENLCSLGVDLTNEIAMGRLCGRAGKGHESSTRKKKRKSGEASATSAAAEMPNLIETLFLGAKTTSNNADVSLANTSATFARLRDLNILAEDKANDVLYACNVISQLREATAQPSDSSELGMGSVDSQKLTPHPLSTSCKSSFKLATRLPRCLHLRLCVVSSQSSLSSAL